MQLVGVGLRDVATAKDRRIRLDGEQRHVRFRGRRTQRLPLHRSRAFACEPFGKFFIKRGLRRRRGIGRRRLRLRFGIFDGFRSMLRRPFFRQLREQFCSERGVLFLLLLRVRLREINVRLVGVVHERHELKIFAVRERVELVRVALRAAEREAEPRRARRRDAVRHRVEAELVRIDAALLVEHRVAVEAGRDFLIERRAREHVSRDLLDRELIERLVGVQRIDDPVAIRPDRPRAIFLVAVRVRIAREVEPLARPAFAVARRGEEAIDPLCHDCVARGGRGARVTW